jgi:hypothetical protein
MNSRETILWKSVIAKAALDANANIERDDIKGAKWHYNWSKTANCRLVCEFANMEYSIIADGFKKIYLDSLKGNKVKKTKHVILQSMDFK